MRWSIAGSLLGVALSAAPAGAQIVTPMTGDSSRSPQAVEIQINRADAPVAATFAVPAARLWPLALLAYMRTGLKVSASDPVHRRITTQNQVLWNQLKGHSLSDFFDCGRLPTGPIADRWRLHLNAQLAVLPRPTADSSGVAMVMVATSEPTDGSSSSGTPCVSRGTLERAITDEIGRLLPERESTN